MVEKETDPTPDDPVDPVPPTTGSGQGADSEASRSGDPVESQKLSTKAETESRPSDSIVESFTPNYRITGSSPSEMLQEAHHSDVPGHDPVVDPPRIAGEQQLLLMDQPPTQSAKTDVLRYFPDLMPSGSKRRLT